MRATTLMDTKQCAVCGKDFPNTNHNRRYCSGVCKNKARQQQLTPHLEQRECANPECGKTFTPRKTDNIHCSAQCGDRHHTIKRRVGGEGRDEQMSRLYRYYESHEDIVIPGSDLPTGTRLMWLSDQQIPFIDEALDTALNRFIDTWRPNYIVYNGDVLDCYVLSEWDQRPERLFSLSTELEQARDYMHTHRVRSPGVKQLFIEGNHEDRLRRVIWKHAQGFSFLVSDLAEALELEKTTIGFVPYGRHIDIAGFVATHGHIVSQESGYTAKRMMDKYRSSGVSGHTHRCGSHSKRDMHGRSHTWYEQGCLCRMDLEYIKGIANWQQGFLIATVYDEVIHPQLVRVIESDAGRSFVVNGERFKVD